MQHFNNITFKHCKYVIDMFYQHSWQHQNYVVITSKLNIKKMCFKCFIDVVV